MHSAVFATATCPSVRPSVSRYRTVSSRAKAWSWNVHHLHLIAPWFHFLARYESSKNSQAVTPKERAKWEWGRFLGNFQVQPICRHSPYLENGAFWTPSYYRTLIGNHMQAIEWCHFRWPWVTHDPDFNSVARICQLQLGFLVVVEFGSASAVSSPNEVWGGAPAESEFGAF